MRKIVVLLALLVLLAGGWGGLWFLAAREADKQVDAWIASEQQMGRNWACPDRHTGGFPFELAVSCTDPTYSGQAGSQRVDVRLAQLVARLRVTQPRRIAIDLQAPFSFKTSDGGTDVKGMWRTMVVDLGALPTLDSAALHGSGLSIDGMFNGVQQKGSHAEALDTHFSVLPDPSDPTVAFEILIKSLAIPTFDDLLGGTDPVDVVLAGRLDRADASGTRTPEQAMERWRRAGGHVEIERSSVSRAGSSVTATGTLALDDAHRLKGRLDAEFMGLEPILARYGISGNLAAVGSLMSTLFGNGGRSAAPKPGALALPISFRNGRIGVGPITLDGKLTPLY